MNRLRLKIVGFGDELWFTNDDAAVKLIKIIERISIANQRQNTLTIIKTKIHTQHNKTQQNKN
jgi:hypothetical protein